MGSTFSGINTALTSLYAQRRGLDVTGQNIANASTEGYTRQRVVMQSQNANLVPGIYATTTAVGSGVTVSTVERLRNTALDQRSQTEHANSAYLNTQAGAYALIEDVFAEPSDTALQARLQDMWDGWNAVATNPDKAAPKSALIEQATTVAATLNDASASLANQFNSNRAALDTYVDDVNKAAEGIAKLNKQIVQATQAGLQANELQDQRATQMLKLSKLIGATSTDLPNGAMNVYVGNAPMVAEFNTREIKIDGAVRMEDLTTTPVKLTWRDTGADVQAGGTMGAMMNLVDKDGIIADYSGRLDSVAKNLVATMTAMSGYSSDGVQYDRSDPTKLFNFFTGTTAADIAVGITNPDRILVSEGNPMALGGTARLDGNVADQIADRSDDRTWVHPADPAGTPRRPTPDAEYQSIVGDLGVAAQSSIRRRDIQNAVTDEVDAARNAESGVNLDEEMTNLLTYQRGYEAASRVLTTIDSMLDQLINRTGLVGR